MELHRQIFFLSPKQPLSSRLQNHIGNPFGVQVKNNVTRIVAQDARCFGF